MRPDLTLDPAAAGRYSRLYEALAGNSVGGSVCMNDTERLKAVGLRTGGLVGVGAAASACNADVPAGHRPADACRVFTRRGNSHVFKHSHETKS
jgi:hypothetical protein